jgi:hypothetical protein
MDHREFVAVEVQYQRYPLLFMLLQYSQIIVFIHSNPEIRSFSSSVLLVNEMVQGPCAHLQLHETSTVVLDRQNVNIDRLNVISSGSVV